jgi:hypothetical protein
LTALPLRPWSRVASFSIEGNHFQISRLELEGLLGVTKEVVSETQTDGILTNPVIADGGFTSGPRERIEA